LPCSIIHSSHAVLFSINGQKRNILNTHFDTSNIMTAMKLLA
jgi:hypothetical protein